MIPVSTHVRQRMREYAKTGRTFLYLETPPGTISPGRRIAAHMTGAPAAGFNTQGEI
ncbi:hypothetical protein SS05631_c25170 [Sinorhizobium sp. CCBAU 05631]|uniref:Uncharacterized protein n=1 Tax=Rhizobium fredii TaxID=380 RepID=A0A2L0H6V5_RHIFR|nr:hypothetical protein SS05631_c25170 [Sinorhizobium sp. CCBAU 05631]AUX77218.1 hypothetical protein NXT3_CH02657 [Sinorhizobium fredii]